MVDKRTLYLQALKNSRFFSDRGGVQVSAPSQAGTPLGRRWGSRRVWWAEHWTPNTEHL